MSKLLNFILFMSLIVIANLSNLKQPGCPSGRPKECNLHPYAHVACCLEYDPCSYETKCSSCKGKPNCTSKCKTFNTCRP